jgi:hypothetical protein
MSSVLFYWQTKEKFMDIETWFETRPSEIVNEIAREKRFIMFAIHSKTALVFKNQDYLIKDILTMSRKVKNATQKSPVTTPVKPSNGNGNGKTRWGSADIRSKAHKDAVREMAANPNFVLDTIVELVDDGYDLHIKRTDTGSTVRSMLFCSIDGHINKGGGLSAEAPDAWLSLSALVYKHVNILDGAWFATADDTDEDDNWR